MTRPTKEQMEAAHAAAQSARRAILNANPNAAQQIRDSLASGASEPMRSIIEAAVAAALEAA